MGQSPNVCPTYAESLTINMNAETSVPIDDRFVQRKFLNVQKCVRQRRNGRIEVGKFKSPVDNSTRSREGLQVEACDNPERICGSTQCLARYNVSGQRTGHGSSRRRKDEGFSRSIGQHIAWKMRAQSCHWRGRRLKRQSYPMTSPICESHIRSHRV